MPSCLYYPEEDIFRSSCYRAHNYGSGLGLYLKVSYNCGECQSEVGGNIIRRDDRNALLYCPKLCPEVVDLVSLSRHYTDSDEYIQPGDVSQLLTEKQEKHNCCL